MPISIGQPSFFLLHIETLILKSAKNFRLKAQQMNVIPKTIRVQIMMAFSVCFVFMAAIIAVNYNNFRLLSRSMVFLSWPRS